jgi:transposase, IS30 family
MLGHLPAGHTAEEVRDVLVPLIGTLPEHLRGSLTWDQGCEMAAHKQFTVATGVPVYFCDPHSPLPARVEREHQRPAGLVSESWTR